MASVPVEIRGTLYDLQSKSSRQVFLAGEASRSDVSVGGGPIYPPSGGGGEDIWGPTDPRPSHPIYIPPVPPDPPIDTVPPPADVAIKPPPDGGGWAYVSAWGWGYFPSGSAGPKR